MISAQHRLDTGHQFLGVKGLDHIVVGSQFQPQHFVEDLSLGGEHDDGDLRGGPQFPAYLISVDAGKHQVQKDDVGFKFREYPQSLFSIQNNHGLVTFFR